MTSDERKIAIRGAKLLAEEAAKGAALEPMSPGAADAIQNLARAVEQLANVLEGDARR